MMRKIYSLHCMVLLCLGINLAKAQAPSTLYISNAEDGTVYNISLLDGTLPVPVTTYSPTNSVGNLAVGPNPDNLSQYVFTHSDSPSGATVYRNTTSVGTLPAQTGGLTTDPQTGVVYGITSARQLLRATPNPVVLGTITGDAVFNSGTVSNDSFFDSYGNIYTVVISGGNHYLYKIDTNTLVAEQFLTITGTRPANYQGLAFYDGKIYAAEGYSTTILFVSWNNARIYEIDPDTGVSSVYTSYALNTYIGPFPGGDNLDLASSDVYIPPTDLLDCTDAIYLSQGNNTRLMIVGTDTNPFSYTEVGTPLTNNPDNIRYNATAFNPVDGYLYAMQVGGSGAQLRTLLRIHPVTGEITTLGPVTDLPVPNDTYNAGEIDEFGNYYVRRSGSQTGMMFKIDISTLSATSISLSGNSGAMSSDFAYNRTNGLLYFISSTSNANEGKLHTINPATGVVTVVANAQTLTGPFGAMYGDANGFIYGASNNGGLYQFNTVTGEGTLLSNSPSSSTNDGAHCVDAPITLAADLYVTKTDGTEFYNPGTTTTYTIEVGNNGPFGVQNAEVEDLVPAGIPAANVSYTAVASAGSSTTVSGTQTGAINDLVSLPVGGTVTYTVTVTIPASFTGDLVNTVTVTPPLNIDDVDMSNNTATDTDIPEPIPFECEGNGTIFTIKSYPAGTQLYWVDYSTVPYTEEPIGDSSHGIQYHGIGYNRDDNFLYGFSLVHEGAEAHKLYRIGNNGVPVELGVVDGLDTSGGIGGWISGGFADDGKFFVKRAGAGAGNIYVIDIDAVAIDMIIPAGAYDTGDVTFADGKFYFLSRNASTMGRLISIDYAAPHTITELPYVNSSIPGGNHGGIFSTASGKVLGIDNNGKVYHYNLTTGEGTQIGTIGNWVQAAYDATSCLGDFDTYCTQPGLNGTPTVFTQIGISDREGLAPNWPAAIPNGFIAIESENKGFVITRIQNDALITEPEEGMLIYDMDAACVKLYYDDEWHCLERSCNE